MFVGVERRSPPQSPVPDQLEPLEFELPKYMEHVHVGPCQAPSQKWKDLKTLLAAHSEIINSTSLEVYGHRCDHSANLETAILIGLQQQAR